MRENSNLERYKADPKMLRYRRLSLAESEHPASLSRVLISQRPLPLGTVTNNEAIGWEPHL